MIHVSVNLVSESASVCCSTGDRLVINFTDHIHVYLGRISGTILLGLTCLKKNKAQIVEMQLEIHILSMAVLTYKYLQ